MRLFLLVHSCFIFFSIQESKGENENQHKCFPSCPDSWEKKEDRCFLWPQPILSWLKAEEFCNENDAYLASITSLEIHRYIEAGVKTAKHKWTLFWIGGTDQETEGTWKWTDGSAWNFTKWATLQKQPNNFKEGDDCLRLWDLNAEVRLQD